MAERRSEYPVWAATEERPLSREEYVEKVLHVYRHTPGTSGTVRQPDRLLAAQWHERGLSLTVVEHALVLAASRRLFRRPKAPPLGTIRSLAYFTSVIEEVLASPVSPVYFEYLRNRIQRYLSIGR